MGVVAALAIGGLAAGAAGGILGSIGQSQQANAQYLANKIEVERNNFQNSLATDKKNFAAARAAAMRKWNNKKIAESALVNFTDAKRFNRETFQANLHNTTRNEIAMLASLDAKATGRNLRGGTADLIKQRTQQGFQQERQNLYKQRFAADISADRQYEAALNQRDLFSYEQANIYMPGSTGVKPGSNTLNMIAGILGGGASGLSSGVGIASGLHQMGKLNA